MKCRSSGLSLLCQSERSADKSISSAVQNDATCCLYMDHRSGYAIGNREKRDPSSSVRQIVSASSSFDNCLGVVSYADEFFDVLFSELVSDLAAFTDPPLRARASCGPDVLDRYVSFSTLKSGCEPPRKVPRNARPFLFISSGVNFDLAGTVNGSDAEAVAKQPIDASRVTLFPRGIFCRYKCPLDPLPFPCITVRLQGWLVAV
mmetsp:Transcript_18160/g.29758  ORF Transcript_18160/g.29758 Transcript_18160/m.29758 type:complete len:204 (+) Transcript_18160:873-1484(+)